MKHTDILREALTNCWGYVEARYRALQADMVEPAASEAKADIDRIDAALAALYTEHSKHRTGLSVEDVMTLIPQCMERGQLNETYLRRALTAKLNELNTQTNG